MFRDKEQELKRLEKELLRETQEETEDPHEESYVNQRVGYQAYNTDVSDTDMERYSEQVRRPGSGKTTLLLCAVALLLIAGIFGVLCYWYIRFFRG